MMNATPLTELIHRARGGDRAAADAVFAAAYQQLRRLARARLRASRARELLDTSALVHETYLRFAASGELRVDDRVHFLRWSGRVMRSVIVDMVRRKQAERRGGDAAHLTLTTGVAEAASSGEQEILRVHEALDELALAGPRLVDVVELRYFAGLTEPEIAEALGVTERTVRRDWTKARLLLRDALA
jgi:RNA polymerase sigma factor (TIGR02999 family)